MLIHKYGRQLAVLLLLAGCLIPLVGCQRLTLPGHGSEDSQTDSPTQLSSSIEVSSPSDSESTLTSPGETSFVRSPSSTTSTTASTSTPESPSTLDTTVTTATTSDPTVTEMPAAVPSFDLPETSSTSLEQTNDWATESDATSETALPIPDVSIVTQTTTLPPDHLPTVSTTSSSSETSRETDESSEPSDESQTVNSETTEEPETSSEEPSETEEASYIDESSDSEEASSDRSSEPVNTDPSTTSSKHWIEQLEDMMNDSNKTTTTEETKLPLGSADHPVPLGETAIFDGRETLFDRYKAELTLQNVIRGKKAERLIQEASPLNPSAPEGLEYLILELDVAVTDMLEEERVDLSSYSFTLVSSDGNPYTSTLLISSPEPTLEPFTEVGHQRALIPFYVSKDDKAPRLVFLARNYGGLWLQTSPASDLSTDDEDSVEPTAPKRDED